MTNSPADDLKDFLVSANVGEFNGTDVWGIFVSKEPTDPDSAITLYDKGGTSPNPKFILDEPTVRIRIRGEKMKYQEAWAKAAEVKEALLGITPQTLNGTFYTGILMLGDIMFLHYDENNRPILVTTWQVIREVSASTYRTGL